eukprot:TRINITY_DN5731_c0_g1_i1.p1 TRINITY_DN5731_c0_g1~~TRINITY_DN5731_c0_g1_i1.p1  ORF type:complete len:150 (+),score=38.05 TRINITY_DN5731_c0_g1_i1:71-520(+)
MTEETEFKTIELLSGAVGNGEVARNIEEALIRHYGSPNNEYRAKVRQLLFNLRDVRNAHLRQGVCSGQITAEQLISMDHVHLANPELQEELHELEHKTLENTITQHASDIVETEHTRKIEFLTAVGRIEAGDQSTHPPPDAHTQMDECK